MAKLEGRVAIVTGAAMGIGRAITLRLAQEGADVVAVDINSDLLQEVTELVQKCGRKCVPLVIDVTKSAQVKKMVRTVLREFGRIDILVNNVGGSPSHASQAEGFRLDEEHWDRMYELNLKSQFIVTSLVVPHMQERKYGKIINIASPAARGQFYRAAYGAAKAGVISFTRSLAMGLGKYNINVNAVSPGMVLTSALERDLAYLAAAIPAYSGLTPKQIYERWLAKLPVLKRIQEPKGVANAVAFLVSEEANNITGQLINVDGGMF